MRLKTCLSCHRDAVLKLAQLEKGECRIGPWDRQLAGSARCDVMRHSPPIVFQPKAVIPKAPFPSFRGQALLDNLNIN